MNALELADEVKYRFADEDGNFDDEPIMGSVYSILIKQQAEKEALKVRSWEGDSLISKLSEEIEALKAKNTSLVMQIDIQKAVSRDLDMDILKGIILKRDAEILALKEQIFLNYAMTGSSFERVKAQAK